MITHSNQSNMNDLLINPNGVIEQASLKLSPNRDSWPDQTTINLVVIHGISLPAGIFGGEAITQLFLNQLDCSADSEFSPLDGLRVSSHLLIDRYGQLTQFVPFTERAWHAGRSTWQGQPNCNDFALGIELEGADRVAYTPCQYNRLIAVLIELMATNPAITEQRIVGHSQIAPGRKTDPGPAFNWPALQRRLRAEKATLQAT